jgi:uncharacterized membrane protein
MAVGAALITTASLDYFDPELLPPFVIEKLPLRFETLWLASLRIHVASALLSLPLCLLLMTRTLQRRGKLHRWVGRIAASVILFGLVPSGAVLAFDAKGGAVVTAGFLLSGAIVGWCVVRGVQAARRRELLTHQRAMNHVVAQMSVAVSSRALIIGLDVLGWNPDVSYVVALWVPVLASAAVAELVSRRPALSAPRLFVPVERNRREVSAEGVLVRVHAGVRPVARVGR